MKKAKKTKSKKTKAPERKTALDRLAARLRTALRRESANVIEIGNLLIECRKNLPPDEGWQEWLDKNFALTYRTALNYMNAAEYVARKGKSETISHFANLSPTVLYRLAAGSYGEQEEAAILAEARERRIDENAADAICEIFAPPDAADDDQEGGDGAEPAAAEDPEITAIIDGPPPAVPPPAPIPPPTNYALRDFDQAVSTLKRLMTKQAAQFAGSAHSGDDLENVASFMDAIAAERAETTVDGEPQTVAAAGTHSSRSRHAKPRRIYVDFLKLMKPGDFRVELQLLSAAVASLELGCTISVESPEEVSGDDSC